MRASVHRWSTNVHLRITRMPQVHRPANLLRHILPMVRPTSQDRLTTVTPQLLTRLIPKDRQTDPCQPMNLPTEHECTYRTHSRNRRRRIMTLNWGLVVDQVKSHHSQASRITLRKAHRHLNLPDNETVMI